MLDAGDPASGDGPPTAGDEPSISELVPVDEFCLLSTLNLGRFHEGSGPSGISLKLSLTGMSLAAFDDEIAS